MLKHAEDGKLGPLDGKVWDLASSMRTQTDEWKSLRRDVVYKLFMDAKGKGVNTPTSATHLALFLFYASIHGCAVFLKFMKREALNLLDSVTDVVEYSVFHVDILAFFDMIPDKYYSDKETFTF